MWSGFRKRDVLGGFLLAVFLLAVVPSLVHAAPPVVISEIYYQPPASQGELVEFVEVQNASSTSMDLEGWRLDGAVRFRFGDDVILAPGTCAVVSRDPDALAGVYSAASPRVVGKFTGRLDNGGEDLVLLDADGAFVDSAPYDDQAPWDQDAAGAGGSLQRLCVEAPGWNPGNWTGVLPPNPGLVSPASQCPPPPTVAPPVIISEVYYHPVEASDEHSAFDDGEYLEFVEIYNSSQERVDLTTWRFDDGVQFSFPPGAFLDPGEYGVVCRDEARLAEAVGAVRSFGNYQGRLSNGGERIALVDSMDRYVDSVRYSQNDEWPYGADGFGHSLERVVLSLPASDPANWAVSRPSSAEYLRGFGEGGYGQGLSQKFLLSIDGPGEILVDDLVLEDLADPGVNLLANGDFENGLQGWNVSGTAAGSLHSPGVGVGGSGALRLLSDDFCPEGECGNEDSVSQEVSSKVIRGHTYRVSLQYRYVAGSPSLTAGLFRGAAVELRRFVTPGAPNSTAAAQLPISVSQVRRFPLEPTSSDPTSITALVRAPSAPGVVLVYTVAGETNSIAMADDGLNRDGSAGDGVFGVELPAFPHDTQVRFRIVASVGEERGAFPRPRFAGSPLPEEVVGYYVNDLQVDSDLPVYHVLLDGVDPANPESVNGALRCISVKPGAFAYRGDLYPNVGIRFRGNTACYVKKRNFKLIFDRLAPFRGVRKVNLNGLWTDKAIVREHLAWDFVRRVGAPYCETEFVRVHLNGAYHGLFLYVEHPDSRFLDRNDLNAGNLYKARQPSLGAGASFPIGVELWPDVEVYRDNWERETNEMGDYSDLVEFVGAMHADGRTRPNPSVGFWSENSFERIILRYQVGQVILNNIDSFAKNHFLYHDRSTGRWGFLTWDLDLTFGKFFLKAAVKFPERPVGTLNDYMLSDPEVDGDLNPWFGATVLGNERYNWLVDFFFRAMGPAADKESAPYYQRAYLVRLLNELEEKYSNAAFDRRIDELASFLEKEVAEDYARWGRYPSNVEGYPDDLPSNLQIMKRQIRLHRDFLLRYLSDWHPETYRAPRVQLTEILYLPEQGDSRLEFVEFQSLRDEPLDLSGWKVQGIGYVFPEGSIVPARTSFVVARDPDYLRARYPDRSMPHLFGPYEGRLSNEGEELLLLDAGRGMDGGGAEDFAATIDCVRYDDSAPWPEVVPGHSIELDAVSQTIDNADPAHWFASAMPGGTPGTATIGFLRGDSNADRELSLTDAVFTLNYLFTGGVHPPCLDASDSNDDGIVDVADGIHLLGFLFLGGPEPPPPYPVEGVDPTLDAIQCSG